MRSRRHYRAGAAFTLAEGLIALGVLSLFASAAIATLLQLNRFALVERTRTNAKELCQERLEECMAAPFNPGTSQVGSALGGSWPITNPPVETVNVVVDADNATALTTGKRTTTVELADSSTNLLRVTVSLAYKLRGKDYTYEMASLRAPD